MAIDIGQADALAAAQGVAREPSGLLRSMLSSPMAGHAMVGVGQALMQPDPVEQRKEVDDHRQKMIARNYRWPAGR